MAKVPINIIKEWFRNTMKPPEAQFWAWLDSFWHKDEEIPQSAVQNLVRDLQLKADLVDGVVPEEQLPFSVVTSEIITLGTASVDGNTVNLAVHSSGENKVRVKGKLITRTFPNSWNFTPLVGTGYKVLRGYAVKWEDDFLFAEGEELPDITDPEIPENALELFKFTVSPTGVVQDEQEDPGFKLIAEDAFKNIIIPTETAVNIVIAESPSSSFNLLVGSGVISPKIGSIRTKSGKNSRDGHVVTLYNDSAFPITILAGTYAEISGTTIYGFATEFELKPQTYQQFKRRNNLYEVLGGGGSAEFPEGAVTGAVLAWEDGEPVWSNRLTTAEAELDAEIVNRAAADANLQTQINTENATRSNVVDKMLHYWDAGVSKWISSGLKFVSGAINQLEFTGRIKADAIVLPNNTNPVVANRLRSDGTDLYFSNGSSVETKLATDVQKIKKITGNIILDDSFHNSVGVIEANCTITITSNLRGDFTMSFDIIGNYVATFTEGSGVTFNSPFGKVLKGNAMCTLFRLDATSFRLNGGLLPN